MAAIGERHGRLDVLVNSAGILIDAGEPPATEPNLDMMHADARRQPVRHLAADHRRTALLRGRARGAGSSA